MGLMGLSYSMLDSVSGGGIPFKSDALFWLDGTIIYSAPNYYFKDKTANGRNFLITGYDFDAAWTKGFPYKSAATISAPIGDAALIAVDVNNYLYDSGGTPNQIPVISLFQDVDYEHKLFCKHETQVVDGNGVETYEPRVKEIVLYNNVKTGADLTKCNTYYGVPAEITSNVKWVDAAFAGTPLGTKAQPYKTLTAAEAGLTAEDTVYVKGVFNETNYWYPKKHANWIIIGLAEVKSTGTTYTILSEAKDGHSINGINVNGQGATTYLMYSYFSTLYNKLRLINPKTGGNFYFKLLGTGTPTFTDCIFKSTNSATEVKIDAANSITFNNGFIDATIIATNSKQYDFNHSFIHINSGSTFINAATSNVINLLNCRVELKNCSRLIYSITGALSLNIYDSSFLITTSAFGIYNADKTGLFNFKRNRVVNNSNGANFTLNTVSIDLQDNHIDSVLGSGFVVSGSATESNVSVINNTFLVRADASYGVRIGGESSGAGDNKILTAYALKNKILGANYFSAQATLTTHGIIIGFMTTDPQIKHNYVNGCHFGAGFKGNNSDYINGIVSHNIITNNVDYGILMAGSKNAKIYNNTLINNESEIYLYAVASPNGATGQTIKNNIIINENGLLYEMDADSTSGHTIDYNIYYSNVEKPFNVGGTLKTFAEWQALGYDAHSIMLPTLAAAKALFTDYDNGDYSLATGSAAIGVGVALDAAYDDGLDASTVWGTDSQLPVVATKQQGANWDIGAYVH